MDASNAKTTTLLLDGLDFTPEFTLSTIQFGNEALNTVTTSLLTALIIANLVSIINRLILLTRPDVFSYRSYARSHVFQNSDDPLRIWSWMRGWYDFRANGPRATRPLHYRISKRLLLVPLCARIAVLVVTIGSIALALPYEKRLDACSRGDYALTQEDVVARPIVKQQDLLRVCYPIPLKSDLGAVRSTASYCSFSLSPGDVNEMANLVKALETTSTGRLVAAAYSPNTGVMLSIIASGQLLQASASFIEWRTENGDFYHSLLSSWDGQRFIEAITVGLSFAMNETCKSVGITEQKDSDFVFSVGFVDCAFNANEAFRYVTASVRESMRFRKQKQTALRVLDKGDEMSEARQTCPVDVTVQRPMINIVPLLVGLTLAFCLNVAVGVTVSHRGNAMDAAFHLVREVLGHDTGANPLQVSARGDDIENVALRNRVCADGISGHKGFMHGQGDTVVEEFDSRQTAGRCMQVARRGLRNMNEIVSEKGGNAV